MPPDEQGAALRESGHVLELSGEATPVRVLLRDLWRHRGLALTMARADYKARYRSAAFGVLWGVMLPLVQGLVLVIVFTRVVRLGQGDDYPAYVMTGTMAWSYFATSMAAGSTAIVDESALASKVYFPRMLPSLLPAAANAIAFMVGLAVVTVVAAVLGTELRPTVVLLPAAAAIGCLLVWSLSSMVSLAHVYFRDVKYIVQAVLLVWFYLTPVFYRAELASSARVIIELNPVTGFVELVRWCIFGSAPMLGPGLRSLAVAVVLASFGALLSFRRHERVAIDRL